MKPKFRITAVLGAILLVAAPTQLRAETQDCDVTKPGLCRILGDLSSILSSTNPEPARQSSVASKGMIVGGNTTDGNLRGLAPASGIVAVPLHSNNISEPSAQKAPLLTPQIDAAETVRGTIVTEPRLSPDTKRLLRGIPAEVNSQRSSSPRLIDMQRGYFENDDDPLSKEPESSEAPAAPASKPKPAFEISVEDVKTTENEISMLEKARKALLTGQYESAIALYKAVLAKLPKDRDALFGLATTYHRSGQRPQARAAYSALIAAYPQFQDGLNNFLVLASEEAPQDALRELSNLEARNPNFAAIHAQKAVIYSRLGQNNQAVQSLERAMSLQPENVIYKYNIAAIYDSMGENQKAVKFYSEVLNDSVHGQPLPASRNNIAERISYLAGKTSVSVAE